MKLLVTGAAGFLGTRVVERLLAHGERDLRLMVRPGSRRGRLDSVVARHPDARVDFFAGTLSSQDSAARAVDGIEGVYHLAAVHSGAPADMYLNTVVGTKNLLEPLVRAPRPVPFVHVSSFGVYGTAELPRAAVVDEQTPLEPHPERRDVYSQTKLRQERLIWETRAAHPFPLVVLRPGVIYGPDSGSAISARVGLSLFGRFLILGGENVLPLTYVDNCADAIVVAGRRLAQGKGDGEVFNVVDDDLPTCREYLSAYERGVARMAKVPVPFPLAMLMSRAVEWYHGYSKGQLPAIFTPYRTRTSWGGNRFSNARLRATGWAPEVSTEEGLRRTFEALRSRGRA